MKKIAMLMITMLLAFVSTSESVNANGLGTTVKSGDVTYTHMEATAYCLYGKTASGTYTRKGICASSPDHIGQMAVVYEYDNGLPGEYIGMYECVDTGGRSVSAGKVLDVWLPSYQECINYGRKDVYVVWIDGVG